MLVTTVGNEQLWEQFHFEITLGSGAQMFNDVTLTPAGTATAEFTGLIWMAAIPLTTLLVSFVKNRATKERVHQ